MILVSGAAGKTGQAVVAALNKRGARTRALVRREVQIEPALANGAAEALCADITSPADLVNAMKDVRCVYHICPNMHPEEIEIGRSMLQTARSAGAELFVYHSVLHPQAQDMPHHWNKMRVEELIFQSGMDFAILQPCAYMQNILGYWGAIQRDGVYAMPYDPSTQISIVDLEDVAETAASVLTETGHSGAIYELSGPEALSQDAMASQISEVLGRPIIAQSLNRTAWAEHVRTAGMAAYEVDALVRMFEYYEKFNFRGNPKMLECLLGRKPRRFVEYIHHLAAGDFLNE